MGTKDSANKCHANNVHVWARDHSATVAFKATNMGRVCARLAAANASAAAVGGGGPAAPAAASTSLALSEPRRDGAAEAERDGAAEVDRDAKADPNGEPEGGLNLDPPPKAEAGRIRRPSFSSWRVAAEEPEADDREEVAVVREMGGATRLAVIWNDAAVFFGAANFVALEGAADAPAPARWPIRAFLA